MNFIIRFYFSSFRHFLILFDPVGLRTYRAQVLGNFFHTRALWILRFTGNLINDSFAFQSILTSVPGKFSNLPGIIFVGQRSERRHSYFREAILPILGGIGVVVNLWAADALVCPLRRVCPSCYPRVRGDPSS